MLKDALIIYRKEVKNTVKDRRTLVLLILLPLLIMPLIFGVIGTVTARQEKVATETVYSLVIRNNSDPRLTAVLKDSLKYRLADDLPGRRGALQRRG